MRKDFRGERFNRLTILDQFYKGKVKYFRCKCDCGNTKDIIAYNVTSGKTKSCGCLSAELASKRNFKPVKGTIINCFEIIDEFSDENFRHIVVCKCIHCGKQSTRNLFDIKKAKSELCDCRERFNKPLKGKLIGRWRVLLDAYNDNHEHICFCECSCEKHTRRWVLYNSLVKGVSNSCGCLISEKATEKFVSHVGETIGQLTIKEDYMKDGRHYCDCECSCGTRKTVLWSGLKSGSIKSCGHLHKDITSKMSVKDLTGKVFGNLKVIERSGTNSWGGVVWKCFCSLCGSFCDVYSQALLNGATSCGCDNIAITGSKEELEIKEYIKTISGLDGEKVRNLDGKEIDLYYKDYSIGIEFNGSVYHSILGHRFSNKTKLYHQQKFLLAKEKGIHLINIFDVDWQNNKEKIKMYLKSIFIKQEKIFARKCNIKKLDSNIANKFFDKYHLQGSTHFGNICYGLYYNAELVAVMSFGKLRLKKQEDGHYELHRFAVKDGYVIIGGAGKLLKAFEREYSPNYILSYSDNDYFLGNVYGILGFKEVAQSTPRYYWFKNGEELKREQCQLKYLKNLYPELYQEAINNKVPNKEDYIMAELGYCKVYRSGNTKWEKV